MTAPPLLIAFLGDIVGGVGRRAASVAARELKEKRGVHIVIANAENSRNGSGLSPDNYRELRRAGIDAMTLGDHCYKDRTIIPTLDDPEQPVSRPANLPVGAPGKRVVRIAAGAGVKHGGAESQPGRPPLYVMTILGRLFMPLFPDSPFASIDREMNAIAAVDPNAMVIVEVHGEATSEKQALAWHCLNYWTPPTPPEKPRVIAVVGSHTHVPTADARILDFCLAAVTDLGMCGPHRSVIGRDIDATLRAMTLQAPVPLDVASDDARARGVLLKIDTENRRAVGIELLDMEVGGG